MKRKKKTEKELSIIDLPDEVILEIVLFLREKDIFRKFIYVCLRFKDLVMQKSSMYVFRKLIERKLKEGENIKSIGNEFNNDWRAYITRKVETARKGLLNILENRSENITKSRLERFSISAISKGNRDVILEGKKYFPLQSRKKHCVRCHSTYYEHYNHSKSCIIEHNFDNVDHGSSYHDPAWVLGCCGAGNDSNDGDGDYEPKHCFKGKHTDDKEEVEYNDDTITTCKEYGCKRRRKKKKRRKKQKRTGEKTVIVIDD